MSRNTAIGVTTGVCLLLGLVVLLVWNGSRSSSGDRDLSSAADRSSADSPTGGTGARYGSSDSVTDLDADLAAWRKLYGDQPWLTPEQTVALREQRKTAAADLARRIGNSGPGIVQDVRDAIRDAERSREKLVLMDGLGSNASAEAVDALEDVYNDEDLARVKEEALRQLGNSDGEGHNDLLIDEMIGCDEDAMAQTAAAMLYGEADALEALVACVNGDQAIEVRLEAIHSIGGIGDDAAHEALVGIAGGGHEDRITVYAERELDRSFED